jgi:hypothetical protein
MTTHNRTNTRRSRWSFLCLLVLFLLCPGCAGCRGQLTGTVTYEGEPVPSGSVLLVGPDSKPRTSYIEKDGSYKVTDLPPGEAKLALFASKRNRRLQIAMAQLFGEGVKAEGGKGMQGIQIVVGPGGGNFKKAPPIPASYNDLELSGLRTTIHRGANVYPIEIK